MLCWEEIPTIPADRNQQMHPLLQRIPVRVPIKLILVSPGRKTGQIKLLAKSLAAAVMGVDRGISATNFKKKQAKY